MNKRQIDRITKMESYLDDSEKAIRELSERRSGTDTTS